MSKRDWKPGDVGAFKDGKGRENVGMVVEVNEALGVIVPTWNQPGAQPDVVYGWGKATARPLVVIDPEDREQVERLVEEVNKTGAHFGLAATRPTIAVVAGVQAALRSLTAPPKPKEPTGLGAVVEDERGEKWIRLHSTRFPWISDRPGVSTLWMDWDNLKPVRVLSEGVSE